LVVGLVIGLFVWLVVQPALGLVVGLLFLGMISGLAGRPEWGEIKTVETLIWSWPEAKSGLLIGLRTGLIGGLLSGLIILFVDVVFGWRVNMGSGLVLGLIFGPIFGLVRGLVSGLAVGNEIESKIIPNQGIWRSARNAMLGGVVLGVFSWLTVGLVIWTFAWLLDGPIIMIGSFFVLMRRLLHVLRIGFLFASYFG